MSRSIAEISCLVQITVPAPRGMLTVSSTLNRRSAKASGCAELSKKLAVEDCIASVHNKIYLSAVCDPLTSAVCMKSGAMVGGPFEAGREPLKALQKEAPQTS